MKILIVDDEALARARLQDLLQEIDAGLQLLQAENGVQALDLIQAEQPDVALLDIRMPAMDGLELAQHLLAVPTAPAIVFTTAYQEHALEAFDHNAIDYLVKPIRKDRLQRALDKASQINPAQLTNVQQAIPAKPKYFSANKHGKIVLQPVKEVSYLKAEQKYVTAYWPGGELLLDVTLTQIEQEHADVFLRIHRSTLVAVDSMRAIDKDESGNAVMILEAIDERLPISRRLLSQIKSRIK